MKWVRVRDGSAGESHHVKVKIQSSFSICYKKAIATCMTAGGELTQCARDSAMKCGKEFPAGVIEKKKRGPQAF